MTDAAERAVEDAAFEADLSLPAVRGLLGACDQLVERHGDSWGTHLPGALLDADQQGAPWAREITRKLISGMLNTLERAEAIGGDPVAALMDTHGLPGELAHVVLDLADQARDWAGGPPEEK